MRASPVIFRLPPCHCGWMRERVCVQNTRVVLHHRRGRASVSELRAEIMKDSERSRSNLLSLSLTRSLTHSLLVPRSRIPR